MSRKIFYILVPVLVILVLITLLKGLDLNPNNTSIEILDTPLPEVELANLYHWNDIINTKSFQKEQAGHWYLINVWASWCETCRDEHPFLMDLARQGVAIYGFDYNDSATKAKKWLSSYGNPYTTVLWDARQVGGAALGVYFVPETFLIDPKGKIRCRVKGPLTKTVWEKTIVPLIKQDAKK